MLMRWMLLPCLAVLVSISGCGGGDRTAAVTDVTRSQTLVLTKAPGHGHVFSLTVQGDGRIDGRATIALLLKDGTPYQQQQLSGPVTFRWEGDWYDDSATIRYTPATVTGGHLRLTYHLAEI